MIITTYDETHAVSVDAKCVECGVPIGTKPCVVIQPTNGPNIWACKIHVQFIDLSGGDKPCST